MPEPAPNTAVNDQVADQSTTTADSASAETQSFDEDELSKLESSFDDGDGFDGTEDSNDSDSSDSTEGEEADESDPEVDKPKEAEAPDKEKPQSKAEKRKEQLEGEIEGLKEKAGIDPNVEIRDLVAARNAIRESVREANEQVYAAPNEQQLLDEVNPDTGEYYTALEAKVAAMEANNRQREYNEQVADAQMQLASDARRALSEFPMFNAQSPEYNKELADRAEAIIESGLVIDQNTKMIVGSHISPYAIYKTIADAARVYATQGKIEGQKATEQMLASADTPSGAHQVEPKRDADLDAFDAEADRY